MRSSESIGKLLDAYRAAAVEFDPIVRDQVGQIGADRKYKYAGLSGTLEATQPALLKHGISVFQAVDAETSTLVTRVIHSSGEWIEATYPVKLDQAPQACGSALTYARRYSYQSLFCLGVEDDDGAAAQPPKSKKKTAPSPSPPKGEVITEPQRKRLFALAKSAGWNNDQIKNHLTLHVGVASTKDIPMAKYDQVCSALSEPPTTDSDMS
jgi:hypothetical protein